MSSTLLVASRDLLGIPNGKGLARLKLPDSYDAVKWTARSSERVHFFRDFWVFDEWGCMVRFVSGINDE